MGIFGNDVIKDHAVGVGLREEKLARAEVCWVVADRAQQLAVNEGDWPTFSSEQKLFEVGRFSACRSRMARVEVGEHSTVKIRLQRVVRQVRRSRKLEWCIGSGVVSTGIRVSVNETAE
jgi:hypothetical protein